MNLAWHYTTGEKFELILFCGYLKTTLSSHELRENERPVLWFSINQKWEQTASYRIVKDGKLIKSPMLENKEGVGGLVRLGYPHSQLLPWIELWKAAGIIPQMKRLLEKNAREDGSNQFHWMGTFNNISLADLVIETMNECNQWEAAQLSSFTRLTLEQAVKMAEEIGYDSAYVSTLRTSSRISDDEMQLNRQDGRLITAAVTADNRSKL